MKILKIKSFILLVLLFTLFLTLHLNSSTAQAWCVNGVNVPPWANDCPTTRPAAPVAPATSEPEDFSLNRIKDECLASGVRVYLGWSWSNNTEKYEIHRRKAGERTDLKTPATIIATQDAPDTQYNDSKVDPGTSYEYLIKAVNSAGSKFSDFSAPQDWRTVDCNPAALSAAQAEKVRQDKINRITAACTYERQVDSICIQNATSDCLDSGRDETDQYICIGSYRPDVPSDTSLRWNRPLVCDSNGAGIRLEWDTTGDRYQVYRKINNEAFKLLTNTKAAVYTDYTLPNDTLSATYYVASFSPAGLQKSSNQVTFPDRGADDAELRLLNNCKGGSGAGSKDVPTLDPGVTGTISYLELSLDREKFIGQEGEASTTHVYAPGEPVRLGAQLFNSALKPNNGCPVQKVNFKITKQNDDGSTEEVYNQPNEPVCNLHPYKMPSEVGNYTFKVEYSGESNLLAAPPKELSFRVSNEQEVVTEMSAFINGQDYIELFQDDPEFTSPYTEFGRTRSGTVNIGAKVYTASLEEKCRVAQIALKFERVSDENFKKLPGGPEVVYANNAAANCQSYEAPEPGKGSLNEPGVYKLTASFIGGARGTSLKPILESTATMLVKKSGFGKAKIDATIGGEGISKIKSSGSVAGISVQRKDGKLVLVNTSSFAPNAIPVTVCARPEENPENFNAISRLRYIVNKLDSSGNVSSILNEVFPNDCQSRSIDIGDTQGASCYNFTFLEEDQDYDAAAVDRQVCFGEEVQAQPFTYLAISPDAGNISSLDDPTVTVATSVYSDTNHFAVLDDGQPYPVEPFSSTPVSDACKTGDGECVYQLQIYKPNGTFEVKFCSDNQNNCSEALVFSSNEKTEATDPDQITSVAMVVDGTEVELPFDGTKIGFDLAPTSDPQYIRLAIHRADKLRDTFPTLTFIFDENLGRMVEDTPKQGEQPVEDGASPNEDDTSDNTGGQPEAICTPSQFKEITGEDCTQSCASCGSGTGEARIFQCNQAGTGFEEIGGECKAECAAYCPTAEVSAVGSCVDEYYPEPATIEQGGTGCTRHFSPSAYPNCSDDWDIKADPTQHAECQ